MDTQQLGLLPRTMFWTHIDCEAGISDTRRLRGGGVPPRAGERGLVGGRLGRGGGVEARLGVELDAVGAMIGEEVATFGAGD